MQLSLCDEVGIYHSFPSLCNMFISISFKTRYTRKDTDSF